MRCGNSSTSCTCVVEGADGIDVTGDGSPESPYSVGLGDALATSVEIADTATVDLTLTGDGSTGTPYALTADVNPDVVVPQANATLDIVGAKVLEPLVYDAGAREFSLHLSADAGNGLSLGTDDGLHGGAGGGSGGGTAWMQAEIIDDDPLTVSPAAAGAADRPAYLAPWLFHVTPRPTIGDYVWVLPGGTESGDADPETALIIGFGTPHPVWARATVTAITPAVVVELEGFSGNNFNAVAMPGYTPVADDEVVVLYPGGSGTGGERKFLILGLAPA